jgi:hypothetical protein
MHLIKIGNHATNEVVVPDRSGGMYIDPEVRREQRDGVERSCAGGGEG